MTKPILMKKRIDDVDLNIIHRLPPEVARVFYTKRNLTIKFNFPQPGGQPSLTAALYCHGYGLGDGGKITKKHFFSKKRQLQPCDVCGGTGLKPGAIVPRGIGVPCPHCHGWGNEAGRKSLLFKRKYVRGIEKVIATYDTFGDKIDLSGAVTYQEFLAGKMPTT